MKDYIRTHQIFRWYLVLLPLLWGIIFAAAFLWDIKPLDGRNFALAIWGLQSLLMVIMFLASAYFLIRMSRMERPSAIEPIAGTEHVQFLTILPCYNEPVSVLRKSLQTLQNQSVAVRERSMLVLSFEEHSPNLQETMLQLRTEFEEQFYQFDICVHPAGIPGETPGKCSNERYAITHMLPRLQQRLEHFDIEQVVLTVMDSDTLLHRRYLEYIAHDFCQLDDAKRYSAIWQAALFYNWDLGKAYFFTRITALFRTIWMIGFNIPFQVHSMSVYSTSLRLCIDNGYFDPTYQMEDMHFYVSSMNTRRGRIKLRAVYLPVICGPTSGADWKDELHEWQRQAQRWSIGAFEVFHYICTKTSSLGFFVAARLALTMVLLYGIFQSIIFFATLIAIPAWHGYQMTSDLQLWHLMTVSPWLFMGWVFLVDYIFVRRYGLQRERVGWLRNIWHLILTPLVLLSYNAVSFLALHILVVRGKAVCAHDPSEKSCLTAE